MTTKSAFCWGDQRHADARRIQSNAMKISWCTYSFLNITSLFKKILTEHITTNNIMLVLSILPAWLVATCLIHASSAFQAPIGLLSTTLLVAKATANQASREEPSQLRGLLSLQDHQQRNLVDASDICGGRAVCTTGATCVENECVCGAGWLPDPAISPISDAGWFSCLDKDECMDAVSPCAANAKCVNAFPPMRFKCDCPEGEHKSSLVECVCSFSL